MASNRYSRRPFAVLLEPIRARYQGIPPSSTAIYLPADLYFKVRYINPRSRDPVYQWTAIYLVTAPPLLLSFRSYALTSQCRTWGFMPIFAVYYPHREYRLQLYSSQCPLWIAAPVQGTGYQFPQVREQVRPVGRTGHQSWVKEQVSPVTGTGD